MARKLVGARFSSSMKPHGMARRQETKPSEVADPRPTRQGVGYPNWKLYTLATIWTTYVECSAEGVTGFAMARVYIKLFPDLIEERLAQFPDGPPKNYDLVNVIWNRVDKARRYAELERYSKLFYEAHTEVKRRMQCH
jgi:hypothetical protein